MQALFHSNKKSKLSEKHQALNEKKEQFKRKHD